MSEVNSVDCGSCPNITDGCRGLCEKIDLGVSRWSANWHMQEYYQSKHGDYVSAADYATAQSELAALREELDTMTAAAKAVRDEWRVDQQRLADAERRNGELEVLLMNTAEVLRSGNGYGWEDAQADIIDAAINPKPEAASHDEPQCLLCLDKKTIPSNLVDGYVMDCPDCCGEEG